MCRAARSGEVHSRKLGIHGKVAENWRSLAPGGVLAGEILFGAKWPNNNQQARLFDELKMVGLTHRLIVPGHGVCVPDKK